MFELWAEKYRPRRIVDICDQRATKPFLLGFVKSGTIPHLLFSGPAGTGKTTAAMCLGLEILKEDFEANYMELNASDERGINVIRGKIKNFARTKPVGSAPFRIIHLDESDSLTSEAQHALRRTMELYSSNCRFIFACNYLSRIIPPIQSRCIVLRFSPIPKRDFIDRLKFVASKENLKVSDDALDAIFDVSQGDLRTGLNILQAASYHGDILNSDIIFDIAGLGSPADIDDMVRSALSGDFLSARSIARRLLYSRGVAPSDLISQIHRRVILMKELDDRLKADIISYLAEADSRIIEGGNAEIQLVAFLSQIYLLGVRERIGRSALE